MISHREGLPGVPGVVEWRLNLELLPGVPGVLGVRAGVPAKSPNLPFVLGSILSWTVSLQLTKNSFFYKTLQSLQFTQEYHLKCYIFLLFALFNKSFDIFYQV